MVVFYEIAFWVMWALCSWAVLIISTQAKHPGNESTIVWLTLSGPIGLFLWVCVWVWDLLRGNHGRAK